MHNLLNLLASSVFSKQALKSLGKLRFTEFHEIAKILSNSSSHKLCQLTMITRYGTVSFSTGSTYSKLLSFFVFLVFLRQLVTPYRPTRYSFSHNPRHSFKTLDSRNPKPPADSETPLKAGFADLLLLAAWPVPHARYLPTAILLCDRGERQ